MCYRRRAHMVREEAGQVNISSRLRLERGDQGEALRFSPMCTRKQRKDLEQGNDRRLVSRRIPLARETDALREGGKRKKGRQLGGHFRAPGERGQGLDQRGGAGHREKWADLQSVGWLSFLRSSPEHQFFSLILTDLLWDPHPQPGPRTHLSFPATAFQGHSLTCFSLWVFFFFFFKVFIIS